MVKKSLPSRGGPFPSPRPPTVPDFALLSQAEKSGQASRLKYPSAGLLTYVRKPATGPKKNKVPRSGSLWKTENPRRGEKYLKFKNNFENYPILMCDSTYGIVFTWQSYIGCPQQHLWNPVVAAVFRGYFEVSTPQFGIFLIEFKIRTRTSVTKAILYAIHLQIQVTATFSIFNILLNKFNEWEIFEFKGEQW